MITEERRVKIYPHNVEQFIKKYGTSESITRFVNELIEKHFKDRVIELDEANFNVMSKLADEQNGTICCIVNLCLASAEFEILKTEKPKVVIQEQKPIVTKRKIITNKNKIINW